MRTKRKAIAIIKGDHVLIREQPPLRRMEFSEATGFMILRHGFDHYLEVVGQGSAIIIVAGLGLIILAATLLDVLR